MTARSQQHKNTDSDEISLKELILQIQRLYKYLLKKWFIIFCFGISGSAIGFWYAMTKKPVYTASTSFVLEDDKSTGGLGSLAGLASMAGVEVGSGGGIFQGDNIMELYKSRKMIVQTLLTGIDNNGKKELLVDRYTNFNELRKQWAEKPELRNIHFNVDSFIDNNPILKPNRLRDSILNGIVADVRQNYITVTKPDKKLSIIKVDVKAKDEIFAKTFNETIVRNVNNFYLQTKTKKSLDNVRIMQQKVDSVRMVMNGAIYSAVAVADATPNLNPTRQAQRVAPAQRAQFSAETNKAILGSLVQNLEMSKLALMKETPLLEVIDQPNYPLNVEKFRKIKGIILGGLLFGSLIVVSLILLRFFRGILS